MMNIIKDNPTSVIIFDEIDKAHPKIINLLYQMLDEGTIKDAKNIAINIPNVSNQSKSLNKNITLIISATNKILIIGSPSDSIKSLMKPQKK